MTKQRLINSICANIVGVLIISAGLLDGVLSANELESRAAVIKPTAEEVAWLKIPWGLDLKAAQATAKSEGRPIFLWVTGDDPLERC